MRYVVLFTNTQRDLFKLKIGYMYAQTNGGYKQNVIAYHLETVVSFYTVSSVTQMAKMLLLLCETFYKNPIASSPIYMI